MDLLDRLLGHDSWTTERLLQLCRGLSDEAIDRQFDIGNQSLRQTFAHMIGNVEVWTALMAEQPVDLSPRPTSLSDLTRRHADSYAAFGALARRIRDAGRWDDTYVDTLDDPPRPKSFGGTIAHVITHDMTHRGEVQHILERLGVADIPEGDALSWESGATR